MRFTNNIVLKPLKPAAEVAERLRRRATRGEERAVPDVRESRQLTEWAANRPVRKVSPASRVAPSVHTLNTQVSTSQLEIFALQRADTGHILHSSAVTFGPGGGSNASLSLPSRAVVGIATATLRAA